MKDFSVAMLKSYGLRIRCRDIKRVVKIQMLKKLCFVVVSLNLEQFYKVN